MSDSDDSYMSSGSDRDILTASAKGYVYTPTSDDCSPTSEKQVPQFTVPTDSITVLEKEEILHLLDSGRDQCGTQIFPRTVSKHLAQHVHVANNLNSLPGRANSVIIAGGNLLSLTDKAALEKSVPTGVLCDVCVFSAREPVLVLTIMSGDGKKDNIKGYNSQLARCIVQSVRRNTRYSFSVVHGVVEDGLCQTPEKFEEKISQLQRDAHVMSIAPALVMTQNKCLDTLKPILDLMTVVSLPDLPQANASDEGQSQVSSSLDMTALLKRIEHLERDSQRKEEAMEKKYEHVLDKLEKVKQDYLTDTRLSLLMRSRSSSVCESVSVSTVSGYYSAEGESDIDGRQKEELVRDLNREAGKADDKCKVQPELTTEAIQTGDLELVQYNRDINLHKACEEGKLDVVKYILEQGVADINCRGKFGRTPVMAAAARKQVSVFDYLVRQGGDLTVVDDNNDNILHVACRGGSTDIVRKLVNNKIYGIDKEGIGFKGMTPLMMAVCLGQKGVFDFLASEGCNLTAVDNNKDNILHLACSSGHVDIVKYIISLNIVSIESRGYKGRTPVMAAAERGHRGVFDLLVREVCDLTAVDEQNSNILHVACTGGHVDMVKYIISLNMVSIESRGYEGRTPVMAAAECGHRGVFDLLVREGCALTAVNEQKSNILHLACLGGHVDMVKYIISLDMVSIESKGYEGRSPVMIAAGCGHRGVFDLLVTKRCDLTAVDDQKSNILHVACIGGHVDMVKYIISLNLFSIESRGYKGRTPVMAAAECGHRGVFDLLVREGCDLTEVDEQKSDILHVACIGGHVDMVKYIISLNMVSIESRGQVGRTPVMTAAECGNRGVFDSLVREGCDLTAVDEQKSDILHVACIGGHEDMVKYIISLNIVSIESRGQVGRTPVMTAAECGHRGVFDSLVKEGCDLTAVDEQKSNILHVACIGGHVDMVKYIISLNMVSIESRGQVGRTPVMTAAECGHRGVFDLLVGEGCDLTEVDEQKSNILHVACIGGHVDMVKYIISLNMFSIERGGYKGRSPVMAAAECGHRGVFDFLIREGCDLTAVDEETKNILHVACIGGHVDMVKYIISLNMVSIESRGEVGRTPVMTAAVWGHRGVFNLLVREGCDLRAVDEQKSNILHVACIGGHVDMVKYIISLNMISIESRGQGGRTPVMTAAKCGHRGVFDLLVREGCDLTAVDEQKSNILHVACIGGHVDMVKFIISLNMVSIESRGYEGRTPVMTAAECGHRGVFDLLVREGCDLTAVNEQKSNILHLACLGSHVDMVKYIISLNMVSIESRGQFGSTPVMTAAECGHRGVFDFLVREGCDLTAVDEQNNNILHLACLGGHVDMVKYIISLNMVSIESRGQLGSTPVMIAAEWGHRGVFDLLVREGCDLTAVDEQKSNMLHLACIGGDVDMVKYLMTQRGVEKMKQEINIFGHTPVQAAETKGHVAIVSLFEESG